MVSQTPWATMGIARLRRKARYINPGTSPSASLARWFGILSRFSSSLHLITDLVRNAVPVRIIEQF